MNIYKKNGIVIVVLMTYLLCTAFYAFLFKNDIDQPELPSKFKSYKLLEDGVKLSNFEIIRLGETLHWVSFNEIYLSEISLKH